MRDPGQVNAELKSVSEPIAKAEGCHIGFAIEKNGFVAFDGPELTCWPGRGRVSRIVPPVSAGGRFGDRQSMDQSGGRSSVPQKATFPEPVRETLYLP